MIYSQKLEDCCETVIAVMADKIDQLQYELQFKQSRIDALVRENELLHAKLEAKSAHVVNPLVPPSPVSIADASKGNPYDPVP